MAEISDDELRAFMEAAPACLRDADVQAVADFVGKTPPVVALEVGAARERFAQEHQEHAAMVQDMLLHMQVVAAANGHAAAVAAHAAAVAAHTPGARGGDGPGQERA